MITCTIPFHVFMVGDYNPEEGYFENISYECYLKDGPMKSPPRTIKRKVMHYSLQLPIEEFLEKTSIDLSMEDIKNEILEKARKDGI